jgi:hypothetical protein
MQHQVDEFVITRRHYLMIGAFGIGVCVEAFSRGFWQIPIIHGHLWDFFAAFIFYTYLRPVRSRPVALFLSFSVCTLAEIAEYFVPRWVPLISGTFDLWDIVSYALGCTLGLLVDIAFLGNTQEPR